LLKSINCQGGCQRELTAACLFAANGQEKGVIRLDNSSFLFTLVNVVFPMVVAPFGALRTQLAALVASVHRATVILAGTASIPFVATSVVPAVVITAVIAATSAPAVVAVMPVAAVIPTAMATPLLRLARRRLVIVMPDESHRADTEQPQQGQTDYKLLHFTSFFQLNPLLFTSAKIGN
jgi:Na+/melibiose symporter-like transporter